MSNKSSKDDRRKGKISFLPWKIIFYNIFGFSLVAAAIISVIYIVKACHPQEKLRIFDVEEDPTTGKMVLNGFDPERTDQEIIQELGDTLTIPDEVQVIAEGAFYDGTKSTIPRAITKLDWGKSHIEEIGANAFKNANFDQQLTFTKGVTINAGAFNSCKGITKLILPADVTIKGATDNGVFQNCISLTKIDLRQWKQVPTDLGIDTFKGLGELHGIIYIRNESLAQAWKELFSKYGFIFNSEHWSVWPDSDWVVDVETNHEEWIEGSTFYEKYDISASFDDGITVKFNVIDPLYKVKSKDLIVTYAGKTLTGVAIENIGTSYTFVVDPTQLVYGENHITFNFNLYEYYNIYLERGVGVESITLSDVPVDYEQGATFDGTVEGSKIGNKLCLDNCYAIWGDRTDPLNSRKLWAEDAFIYDLYHPDKFTLKTPADFDPTVRELTVHLDESKDPRWTNIGEPEIDGNVYVGIAKNVYEQQILFDCHTKNGYRIDQDDDSTYVNVGGTKYTLNDSTGVLSLENNQLKVDPTKTGDDIKPDVAIQLHVATVENDFNCIVRYEDSDLFDPSAFEIVSAIDNENVVIKVQPITDYEVAVGDTSRLYATITLKNGKSLKITDLTVGAVGADAKTPITMAWESEEWIGKISSIEFFVAANQTPQP